MILITMKSREGSVERRHVGDDETSVRDVVVARYLGSLSNSINDNVVEVTLEKIEHILSDKETK